jgi:hypothetical protein
MSRLHAGAHKVWGSRGVRLRPTDYQGQYGQGQCKGEGEGRHPCYAALSQYFTRSSEIGEHMFIRLGVNYVQYTL